MADRRWLVLIQSLYLTLGMIYSVVVPIWEAPDERAHYRRVLAIARPEMLPGRREAHQPPLYYWLASIPLRVLDAFDQGLADIHKPPRRRFQVPGWDWNADNYRFLVGPHLLRWLNLLLGTGTLWLIFRAARAFAPESPPIAVATCSMVGLLPQFLHVSASVSNDPLANLGGAFLFWVLGLVFSSRVGARPSVLLAILAATLPVLTKLTLAAPALGVMVAVVLKHRRTLFDRPWRILAVGLSLPMAAAMGMRAIQSSTVVDAGLRLAYVRPAATLEAVPSDALAFAKTYWGALGANAVWFPVPFVILMSALALLGLLVSMRMFLPVTRSVICERRRGPWAAVWLVVALTSLAIVRNWLATPSTMGRHVFPAIGEVSLLMTSGWFLMLPERFARLLPSFTIVTMLMMNLALILLGAIPTYYQPLLDG